MKVLRRQGRSPVSRKESSVVGRTMSPSPVTARLGVEKTWCKFFRPWCVRWSAEEAFVYLKKKKKTCSNEIGQTEEPH